MGSIIVFRARSGGGLYLEDIKVENYDTRNNSIGVAQRQCQIFNGELSVSQRFAFIFKVAQ